MKQQISNWLARCVGYAPDRPLGELLFWMFLEMVDTEARALGNMSCLVVAVYAGHLAFGYGWIPKMWYIVGLWQVLAVWKQYTR